MLGHPGSGKMILRLLLTKVVIAVVTGYLVDIFYGKKQKKGIHDLCEKGHCGCGEKKGILRPAFHHSIRLWGYILLFTVGINLGIEAIGRETLESVILGGTVYQLFFTALIGLIPNCASSVLLTELYMQGVLSFAATAAGLCASAGLGLVVLFKVNRPLKETWKLTGLLYGMSVIAGIFCFLCCW